jgi:hypothetical protein
LAKTATLLFSNFGRYSEVRSAPTFISVAWQHVADSITMQNRSMRLIFFVKFMRKVMVLGEEKQPFMKIILF